MNWNLLAKMLKGWRRHRSLYLVTGLHRIVVVDRLHIPINCSQLWRVKCLWVVALIRILVSRLSILLLV